MFSFSNEEYLSFTLTGLSGRPLTELGHNLGLMKCYQTLFFHFATLTSKILFVSLVLHLNIFSQREWIVLLCTSWSITVMVFYQQRDSWCLNFILQPVPISRHSFLHSNDFYISQGLDRYLSVMMRSYKAADKNLDHGVKLPECTC